MWSMGISPSFHFFTLMSLHLFSSSVTGMETKALPCQGSSLTLNCKPVSEGKLEHEVLPYKVPFLFSFWFLASLFKGNVFFVLSAWPSGDNLYMDKQTPVLSWEVYQGTWTIIDLEV